MAYVSIPKDLSRVKSKFLFNLTKRQVVCFGLGALTGVPAFFLAKDALIGILFSGSRSKCLVQKIEIALKELVFGAYPQYRENRDINIMLTYILYGCYYAFYENRKYGDVPVLSSITELTGETAAAALKMVNK